MCFFFGADAGLFSLPGQRVVIPKHTVPLRASSCSGMREGRVRGLRHAALVQLVTLLPTRSVLLWRQHGSTQENPAIVVNAELAEVDRIRPALQVTSNFAVWLCLRLPAEADVAHSLSEAARALRAQDVNERLQWLAQEHDHGRVAQESKRMIHAQFADAP